MVYKIVTAQGFEIGDTIKQLSEKVNDSLKEGWIPSGGVSTTITPHHYLIAAQALIRMPKERKVVEE